MAQKTDAYIEFHADTKELKAADQVFDTLNRSIQLLERSGKQMGGEMAKEAMRVTNILKNNLGGTAKNGFLGIDLNTFKSNLNNVGRSFEEIKSRLNGLGSEGQNAYKQIVTAGSMLNENIKVSESMFDRLGQTMRRALLWQGSNLAIDAFVSKVREGAGYLVSLDKALNDIRIVTDKSAGEMKKFAEQANVAAQSLGTGTKDYVNAALIYYQQGLDDIESKARTDITAKVANVTGQNAQQVSEQLTAIWNGYKASADEAELYIDKVAKVAATTAADLEELSTGMGKVASTASAMGIDIDQLSAILSTVISVTRQAPSTIGNAFKTLFARMEDLKFGKEDEDGIGLGKVSEGLQKVGINVLDQQKNLRGLGDILTELMGKWKQLTNAEKVATAQLLGGKIQYNNLIALMENQDMYTKALEESKGAMGELQHQQDIYTDTTDYSLKVLNAKWEKFFMDITNQDNFKGIIDGLNSVLDGVTHVTNAMGGLQGVLGTVVGLITQFSSKAFAKEILRIGDSVKNTVGKYVGIAKNSQNQAVAGSEYTKPYASLANTSKENNELLNQLQTAGTKLDEKKTEYEKLVKTNDKQMSGLQDLYSKLGLKQADTVKNWSKLTRDEFDALIKPAENYEKQLNQQYVVLKETYDKYTDLAHQAYGSFSKELENNPYAEKTFDAWKQYIQLSDQREKAKTNLEPVENKLDKVMAINKNMANVEEELVVIQTKQGEIIATQNQVAKIQKEANRELSTQKLSQSINLLGSLTMSLSQAGAQGYEFAKALQGIGDAGETATAGAMTLFNALNMGLSAMTLTGSPLGLLAALVPIAINAISTISKMEQVTQETAQASYQAWQTQKNAIEQANQALQDNQNKIEELESKGSITYVEAEELTKLRDATHELETQIKLQQTLEERAKNKAAADAAKVNYKIPKSPQDTTDIEDILNNIESFFVPQLAVNETQKDRYQKKLSSFGEFGNDFVDAGSDFTDFAKFQQQYEEIKNKIQNGYEQRLATEGKEAALQWKESWENSLNEIYTYWTGKNQDYQNSFTVSIEQAKNSLEALSVNPELYRDKIDEIKNYLTEQYKTQGLLEPTASGMLGEMGFGESKFGSAFSSVNLQALQAAIDDADKLRGIVDEIWGQGAYDKLQKLSDKYGITIQGMIQGATQLKDKFDFSSGSPLTSDLTFNETSLGNTSDALSQGINDFNSSGQLSSSSVANLQAIKAEMESLTVNNKELYETTQTWFKAIENGGAAGVAALGQMKQMVENLKFLQSAAGQELIRDQQELTQQNNVYTENQKQLKEAIENGAAEGVAAAEEKAKEGVQQIAKIFDKKIKIQMEIDNQVLKQAESACATIAAEGEAAAKAVSLIGDGYIVSADKAQALYKVAPELYDQAVALADGSLQLNAEVVEGYKKGDQAIIDSNGEAVEAQLQSQIDVTQSAIDSVNDQLTAAAQMYNQEGEMSQQQLDDEMNKLNQIVDNVGNADQDQVTMDKDKGDTIIGNYKAISDASAQSGNDQVQNMGQAFSIIQQQAWAAAESIEGMFKGEKAGAEVSINGFAGTNTVDAETSNKFDKKIFEGILNDSGKSNYEKFVASANELLAYLNARKASLERAKTLVQSTVNNAKNKLAGIGVDIPTSTAGSGGGGSGGSGGSGGGSGGSGGGGSEAAAKEAEVLELMDEEVDVFHDLDRAIKLINKSLDELDKKQQHVFGRNFYDNIQKQLTELSATRDLIQQEIEMNYRQNHDTAVMLQGLGVTFDENWQITNYEQVLQDKIDEVNGVISRYNSLSGEGQTEDEKKAVEDKQKEYEELKQLIDDYEKQLNETIPDLKQQIQDNLTKEVELKISNFKAKIEATIEIGDMERTWNAFKTKVIEGIRSDDILGNLTTNLADILSYYDTGTGLGQIQQRTSQIQELLAEIERRKTLEGTIYSANHGRAQYENYDKEMYEDLGENLKGLMQDMEAVVDLEQQIADGYENIINEIKENIGVVRSQHNVMMSQLTHDINLIKLTLGENAYGELEQVYSQRMVEDTEQKKLLQQEVALWEQKMKGEEIGSKAWKAYRANWEESLSALNSLIEQSISNMIEMYTNMINNSIKDLNKALTNDLGWDYVAEEWALRSRNGQNFLDEADKFYGLEDIQYKWLSAIDSSDSEEVQRKLQKAMEAQLELLREKDKLSQADLDRAYKQYDLTLKEIALAEAQKNKTSMRLTRDAYGNYSYSFVANEDEVLKAEEALNQSRKDLYNFDKSFYNDNLNEFNSVYQELQEKISQAFATKTGDDLEAELNMLREEYGEQFDAILGKNTTAINNLRESMFSSLKLANPDKTDDELWAMVDQLMPQSAMQEMMDKMREEGFNGTFGELFDEMIAKRQELDALMAEERKQSESASQGVYDDLIDYFQDETVEGIVDKAEKQIEEYQKIQEELKKMKELYDQVAQSAKDALGSGYEAWLAKYQEQAKLSDNFDPATKEFRNNLMAVLQEIYTAIKGDYTGVQSFASGGYTGAFGKNGKLALLHEKELVLNQSDTRAFLSAVQTIRTGTGLYTSSMFNNLISPNSGQLVGETNNSSNSNSIVINADFPSVTNSAEIQEAFNNLLNVASQYAYR